jgi:hypothetical protein
MNTKHTPGPWGITETPPDREADYNGDHLITCRNGQHVLAKLEHYSPAERRANARLIAAAPDLLEALQAMVDHGSCSDEEDFFKARAAIAKATP